VFVEEPATSNPLFWLPNCGVHAASRRCNERSAGKRRPADRRADVGLSLLRGAISTRVNFPLDHGGRSAPLKPHRACGKAGLVAGQLTETGIDKVQLSYEGTVAQMNTKALTSAAHRGLTAADAGNVNVVSAPIVRRSAAS